MTNSAEVMLTQIQDLNLQMCSLSIAIENETISIPDALVQLQQVRDQLAELDIEAEFAGHRLLDSMRSIRKLAVEMLDVSLDGLNARWKNLQPTRH